MHVTSFLSSQKFDRNHHGLHNKLEPCNGLVSLVLVFMDLSTIGADLATLFIIAFVVVAWQHSLSHFQPQP